VRDWEELLPIKGPSPALLWLPRRLRHRRTLSLRPGTGPRALGTNWGLGLWRPGLAGMTATGWLWGQPVDGALTVVLIDTEAAASSSNCLPIRTKPRKQAPSILKRLVRTAQPAFDSPALAAAHGVPSRRVERLDDLAAARTGVRENSSPAGACARSPGRIAQLRELFASQSASREYNRMKGDLPFRPDERRSQTRPMPSTGRQCEEWLPQATTRTSCLS